MNPGTLPDEHHELQELALEDLDDGWVEADAVGDDPGPSDTPFSVPAGAWERTPTRPMTRRLASDMAREGVISSDWMRVVAPQPPVNDPDPVAPFEIDRNRLEQRRSAARSQLVTGMNRLRGLLPGRHRQLPSPIPVRGPCLFRGLSGATAQRRPGSVQRHAPARSAATTLLTALSATTGPVSPMTGGDARVVYGAPSRSEEHRERRSCQASLGVGRKYPFRARGQTLAHQLTGAVEDVGDHRLAVALTHVPIAAVKGQAVVYAHVPPRAARVAPRPRRHGVVAPREVDLAHRIAAGRRTGRAHREVPNDGYRRPRTYNPRQRRRRSAPPAPKQPAVVSGKPCRCSPDANRWPHRSTRA